MVNWSPPDKRKSIITIFLHTLLDDVLGRYPEHDLKPKQSDRGRDDQIKKILDISNNCNHGHLDALMAVLDGERVKQLYIIIDGLENVKRKGSLILRS
jgi:hypothetical protein